MLYEVITVDDITKRKILSEYFSFYVQNASVTDKELAPEGKSTLYILVPVPNNKSSINWEKEKDGFRDCIIEHLEKNGSFVNLRHHIVEEKMIIV